ncbi:DUF3649 domain-containing protein [Shewanella canadensis]|uniref:DUF3649 domain-containing protein n=1 Tax=Shewanella canadensis TaxID=271096 RepID=A0A431WRZ3_9GAMM|nr:DUF3649 domain-containing protein [Shewanella canadensis]RTR38392.1 DUF3649 domain-containing protein [Shewanella canadensis]
MVLPNINWRAFISSQPINIMSRSFAAIFAGYLVAASACGLLALIMPLSAAQSTLTAMMLSFSFYAAAAIWAFSVRTSWQAWRDLLLISAILYIFILWVN